MPDEQLVDLTDDQLRERRDAKWSMVSDDVIAAWVAEMDFALAPAISRAVHSAVDRGTVGYPPPDRLSGVPEALAGFAKRRWDWAIDPAGVVLVIDTMGGIELVLRTLCEDAPVVVPTPAYPPFLDVVGQAGRELVTVPLDPDAAAAQLDLDRIGTALAMGARTVLLCQPHNPWGRVFTREELEGLRDVVLPHGARVVSDEVHGALVLPGYEHLPYAAIDGTAAHTVTVTSAAKGWNMPGLKSAQIVANPADTRTLRAVPLVANHGSAPLGQVAARAAYEEGEPWLDAVLMRLKENRRLFAALLEQRLSAARMWALQATYLAWVDARAYGLANPARAALEHGRVRVSDGREFGPGGEGFVRVNLATSPQRLRRIVDGLAAAWEG